MAWDEYYVDDKQKEQIEAFLAEHNIDVSNIKAKDFKLLIRMEDVINKRLNNINDAVETIQKNAIKTVVIAEETGISRMTISRNDVLKILLKDAKEKSKEISKSNKNNATINELREEIEYLKEQIDKMVARDIEIANLRHDNMKYVNIVKDKELVIKNLNEKIIKLQENIVMLNKRNPVKILNFDKDTK